MHAIAGRVGGAQAFPCPPWVLSKYSYSVLCMPFYIGYLGKDEPESKDLAFIKATDGERFRLLEEIADRWKRIANTLKLETSTIKNIQKSCVDDNERIQEVFQVWFHNASALPNGDSYPLSWYGLNELLKDSDLATIAERYFKILEKC